MNDTAPRKGRKGLVAAGIVLALGAAAVLFILPAETGWDPTGVGRATGLVKIARPDNPELERGQARMASQQVLTLGQAAAPAGGVEDSWTYELAPFESIEFKYTIAEGAPVAFRWQGSAPLHYDMHAHPFEGGVELTESYSVGDESSVQGLYTPAFSGIHGWFWQNRSATETVRLTLEATGGMSHSTIYNGPVATERPLAGAAPVPTGTVAGHAMQSADTNDAN